MVLKIFKTVKHLSLFYAIYNGRGTQAVALVNMRVDASENEHPAFLHRAITLTDSTITEDQFLLSSRFLSQL